MELLFKLAVSCTVVFIEVIVNLIFKLKAWHTIRFHIKFPTEFSDKNNSRHATYTLNYISTFLGPYLRELLVSESITNPVISVSALTSFIRYIYISSFGAKQCPLTQGHIMMWVMRDVAVYFDPLVSRNITIHSFIRYLTRYIVYF